MSATPRSARWNFKMCDKELLVVLLKIFLNNLESNCSIYIRTLCTELKAYYFKFNWFIRIIVFGSKIRNRTSSSSNVMLLL